MSALSKPCCPSPTTSTLLSFGRFSFSFLELLLRLFSSSAPPRRSSTLFFFFSSFSFSFFLPSSLVLAVPRSFAWTRKLLWDGHWPTRLRATADNNKNAKTSNDKGLVHHFFNQPHTKNALLKSEAPFCVHVYSDKFCASPIVLQVVIVRTFAAGLSSTSKSIELGRKKIFCQKHFMLLTKDEFSVSILQLVFYQTDAAGSLLASRLIEPEEAMLRLPGLQTWHSFLFFVCWWFYNRNHCKKCKNCLRQVTGKSSLNVCQVCPVSQSFPSVPSVLCFPSFPSVPSVPSVPFVPFVQSFRPILAVPSVLFFPSALFVLSVMFFLFFLCWSCLS